MMRETIYSAIHQSKTKNTANLCFCTIRTVMINIYLLDGGIEISFQKNQKIQSRLMMIKQKQD